jgi:hypothetical protein
MNLVGAYGSDEEEGGSDSGAEGATAPKASTAAKPSDKAAVGGSTGSKHSATDPNAEIGAKKKCRIYVSRLPISRPVSLDAVKNGDTGSSEAPLKRLAELDSARVEAGSSLVGLLPKPRATLGSAGGDAASGTGAAAGGLRLDLSGIKKEKPRVATAAEVLKSEKSLLQPDLLSETTTVPENAMKHSIFGANADKKLEQDGPSADDLHHMRKLKDYQSIKAEDLRDPDWYMANQVSGGPGTHKGKSVALEVSNYDSNKWNQSTHANPNRTQKRKHQINWLAQEAMEKEAELLDRNATSRLTKAQTSMKYGW